MDQQKVFYAIAGMSLVTYLPRLLPAWLLANATLPKSLTRWLRFVPVAVLSTLLLPSLLLNTETRDFALDRQNLGLMVAVPTALLALYTRSFLGTVVVGVGLVAGARYFLALPA